MYNLPDKVKDHINLNEAHIKKMKDKTLGKNIYLEQLDCIASLREYLPKICENFINNEYALIYIFNCFLNITAWKHNSHARVMATENKEQLYKIIQYLKKASKTISTPFLQQIFAEAIKETIREMFDEFNEKFSEQHESYKDFKIIEEEYLDILFSQIHNPSSLSSVYPQNFLSTLGEKIHKHENNIPKNKKTPNETINYASLCLKSVLDRTNVNKRIHIKTISCLINDILKPENGVDEGSIRKHIIRHYANHKQTEII